MDGQTRSGARGALSISPKFGEADVGAFVAWRFAMSKLAWIVGEAVSGFLCTPLIA